MEDKNEIINYKFILLGDSMVGKAAIYTKLLKDQFYESNVSNIGINFAKIYFNDIDIDINGIKEKRSFKKEL